jgi:hypothetical protein
MKRISSLLRSWILAVLVTVSAVGCHESGIWQDDAGNWKRIFREKKPATIKVIHSWFSRSPHFTYEFEYFLQVETNVDFQKRLLSKNPLKQVKPVTDLHHVAVWSQNRPNWFAPKPIVEYDVWKYSDDPASNFRLLIDRKTGDLFLENHQL